MKAEDIVDAKCLQLEDDWRQVATLHLRDGRNLQLVKRII